MQSQDGYGFVHIEGSVPQPGTLAIITKPSKWQIIECLQQDTRKRIYKVRGYVSDHIPLYGNPDDIVSAPMYHGVIIDRGEMEAYIHHGKNRAFFFRCVGDEHSRLAYIEVTVECENLFDAFRLARYPLNQVLDCIVSRYHIPLILVRLTLLSPEDGVELAHEVVRPFFQSLVIGEFGGIYHEAMFAPYYALFREAIMSTSPFYRLLCAYRLYEGVNVLRKTIRAMQTKLKVETRLPKDVKINVEELSQFGFMPEMLEGVCHAKDLFERLQPFRNSVAHFLLGKESAILNMSDSRSILQYNLASVVLLRYAQTAIDNLVSYYREHLELQMLLGSVLPMKDDPQFIIRD